MDKTDYAGTDDDAAAVETGELVDVKTGEVIAREDMPVMDIATARGLYNPDLDFAKLASNEALFYSRGFKLVGKSSLEGVPHGIVNVVFRDGYLTNGIRGDYVSCEAVVASTDVFAMPQFKHLISNLLVWPNQAVIYNDGGTGIRRTLVEAFHNAGVINVGDEVEGENRFDRPMSQWISGADRAATGIKGSDIRPGFKGFLWSCLNGLRVSNYTNEYGDGTTWYIA
jgi:hypothetical protein